MLKWELLHTFEHTLEAALQKEDCTALHASKILRKQQQKKKQTKWKKSEDETSHHASKFMLNSDQ